MRLSYRTRAILSLVVHAPIVVVGLTVVWLYAAFKRDRETVIAAIAMTVAGILFMLYYTIVAVRAILSDEEPDDDAELRAPTTRKSNKQPRQIDYEENRTQAFMNPAQRVSDKFKTEFDPFKPQVCPILFVVFGWSATIGAEPSPIRSPSPADQYQALLKEYQLASSAGRKLTDEERMQFVGQTYRLRSQLALRFVELAEKYPQDPIAVDALLQAVWQVNTTPWPVELVGEDTARARAFELLQRDHLQSDKLAPTCQRISYGFCPEYETFLRAVLEKNPHRDVQGIACLSLAHFLSNRLQRLALLHDEPQQAREFADLFGAEYLAELQHQDRTAAERAAEAIFEQAAEKYGDVKLPDGRTVAEQAAAEQFEVRHLSVGKEAPNIVGTDQDGNEFKLSDYRGKVVLLDFWSEY